MPRVKLGRDVFYVGSVTNVTASVASTDLNVEQLLLTNTTNVDVSVTLTTNESSPTTEGVLIVSANDQVIKDYGSDRGPWWFFASGLKILGTAAGVRYQITGNQRP